MSVPDHTAVRVALWRALHVLVEAPPHVLDDELGLQLAAPDDGWRDRPDMAADRTRTMRAGIVARARFVEDLVIDSGVAQYVLLGAGLDTFAQRRAETGVRVFEIDQPATQLWKRRRLDELGLALPTFVPVDFERDTWLERLIAAGFDPATPAVVASTGVSMYLARDTNAKTLRDVAAALAPGSTFAMTFMIPIELVSDPEERTIRGFAEQGAAKSGTPFISFYAADEITAAAREAGFARAIAITADDYVARYFAQRSDGLRPAMSEQLLVATT
ncbi:MAG TPA: class I SAM-dependent methyltransferase [Kofleriaceae bacterium]|nr:class I SAM-dependent methyltransferase [Kofleriaceae bacterium]